MLVQQAFRLGWRNIESENVLSSLIGKVGACILPDIEREVISLRESMVKERRHYVFVHINAPNSDNYSFVLSALYHYEEECQRRGSGD